MCGIIGYLGERSAAPIIMDSLKRLEYRGYEPAGVAIFNEADGQASVVKSAAKVDTLVERLTEEMPEGRLGIGHTRWATHGRPTVINAHPHTDCHKQVMVIHNGIIENFAELRKDLQAHGHVFISETDTEVVPHLIEEYDKGDLVAAVREALGRLRGAYAMAIFSQKDPDLLIGARLNAPLVVGIGDKEWFVASDITAVIPYTKKVLLLGEGEMVAITRLGPEVSTIGGAAVKPKVIEVKWDISQAQKGGFPHFMAKEINEAPEAVSNALRGRLTDEGEVTFEEFGLTDRQLLKLRDIKMAAARVARGAQGVADRGPTRARRRRGIEDAGSQVRRLPQLHVYRTWHQLPDRVGGGAQTQRDLLSPCRGIRGRRAQAWTDRVAGSQFPGICDRDQGGDPREDGQQHPGSDRSRCAGGRPDQRGR